MGSSATPPGSRPRTVAFYLPQFHPIPENDEWWGTDFTEWTNVRRAIPLFPGHDQPREPGELGYYDLVADPQTMVRQAELAQAHGIDAFCFYYYWFGGKRLLHAPVDHFRDSRATDMPYCLSWANESWTRRWDGKSRDVLISQDYAESWELDIARDLIPHLSHPRYLKVNGRPVLLVHRANMLPDAVGSARRLREAFGSLGIRELHLVAAETDPSIDPTRLGFDAVAEFPPVGSNTLRFANWSTLLGLSEGFRGRVLSYPKLARGFMNRSEPDFVRHPGVTPGWDNSARRGSHATIYVGSHPAIFQRWLMNARKTEQAARGGAGLVFVNAWNEWAEGAYLEPDVAHGRAYLRASRWDDDVSVDVSPRVLAHTRGLALLALGSLLQWVRRIRGPFGGRRAETGKR